MREIFTPLALLISTQGTHFQAKDCSTLMSHAYCRMTQTEYNFLTFRDIYKNSINDWIALPKNENQNTCHSIGINMGGLKRLFYPEL